MENDNSENMELAIRILGNEILAFSISSQSQRKNWVVIAMIIVLLATVIFQQLSPIILQILAS